MYNIFEAPTIRVHIPLDSGLIYFKNLQNIIGTSTVNNILFYGKKLDIKQVERIIELFPNKEYYTPANCYVGQNTYHYLSVALHDIKKKKALSSKIIILNIDLSRRIDAEDIYHMNKLMNNSSAIVVFRIFSKNVINGLEFREFLSYLELFDFVFYFDGLVKPLSVIREHPCNAYLCNGHNCHSKKGNIPRYLHVTENGIYPYCTKIKEIAMLKNISTKSIDFQEYINNEYLNSSEHNLFIELNRILFTEYVINQIFEYLPWNLFMEKVFYERYRHNSYRTYR